MIKKIKSAQPNQLIILSMFTALLIFIVDRSLELGVATAVCYVFVIWILSFTEQSKIVWNAALICSFLTIFGFSSSPDGGELWKVIANRLLSIMVINLTALFIVENQKAIETQARLRAIVNSSKDAIFHKTIEGIVTSWNQGAERLYGYTADEMIGKSIKRLVPLDQPNEIESILEQIRQNKPISQYETIRVSKNGAQRYVQLSVTPISGKTGRIIGASTIAHDITEQKLNEELSFLNQSLKENNDELKQFAYITSHDLQEPLRTITSFVQLLANRYKGQLDSDADEFITYILEGTVRMKNLITDLLSYSRITNQDHLQSHINLEEVFQSACSKLSDHCLENNAQIIHTPFPTIYGNAEQLTELFQHLIINAIKFQKRDQVPQIHINAQQDGRDWIISVSDNGIGLEQAYSDRIFKIFQRLHNREDYSGTGIGLAICKKIVESHGGEIWVESQHQKGATFYFTLPKINFIQEQSPLLEVAKM